MDLAISLSRRSTCTRAKVGAVLVQKNRIVGMGYNGSPPGVGHCLDLGCLLIDGRCRRTIHAEANAILSSKPLGMGAGLVLYSTHEPCCDCIKLAVGAMVEKIMYLEPKNDMYTDVIIRDYNTTREVITVERFTPRVTVDKKPRMSKVSTARTCTAYMFDGGRKSKTTKANAGRGGSR
jgi:dCMP deaminase